ncbi:MAG: hypothetical protein DI587_17210 [Variovorax paradoxus]|nr:MAG: hypothetical protein DI583_17210 [Variovorax paradoxus]PZQ08974.1 MAG: hypothetical protein DI587_17210 [Variovorax paradoxus]
MQHQSVIELLRMWQSHLPTGARPDNSNPAGQRWWDEVEAACAMLGASKAAHDVIAERRRQVEVKGYDTEHDDAQSHEEIAFCAAVWAMPEDARNWGMKETGCGGDTIAEALLPPHWGMPDFGRDRRQQLVKAGGLILAEMERLDRAAIPPSEQEDQR